MNQQLYSGGEERFIRRYEYEDGWVVAADLPVADENVDVDVVGTTAIVVADTDAGMAEAEFELPGAAANVDVHNGVLTIRGNL